MGEQQVPQRFPWERVVPVNTWLHEIRKAPGSSPWFAHGRCVHGRCRRDDAAGLSCSTIKSGCAWLATWANPDGTGAHPGIGAPRKNAAGHERPARGLMLAMGASKPTVIAVLSHLEVVGLIAAEARAGSPGTPRQWATVWSLTMPPDWWTAREASSEWSAWNKTG